MTKQEARAQMKKLRRELEEKERQQMEQKIFEYMTAFWTERKKNGFFLLFRMEQKQILCG